MIGICTHLKHEKVDDEVLRDSIGLGDYQRLVRKYGCEQNSLCLYVISRDNGIGVADPSEMKECDNYSFSE